MSESKVSVTEGSGKNLHTWDRTISSVLVQEQYVLLAENPIPTFSVLAQISTATANSHLIQIMAGSSNNVRVRRIEVYLDTLATSAAIAVLSLFRLSTAGTGGTAITPAAMDTGDSPGLTAMRLPSSKGTESTQVWTGSIYMQQALATSTPFISPLLTIDYDSPRTKPLIIPAGTSNGVALKLETAVAAGYVRVVALVSETSY